jgi:integrase
MAKTRRADGEGSYGRTSDGRHTFTRQITLPDGTPRRVKGEGKSRAIARERCELKIATLLNPTPAPTPRPMPCTVGEQMAHWMDTVHRHAGATTRRTYTWVIDNLIMPHLGAITLADLKHSRGKQWLADLEHAGRAPKTISMALALCNAAIELAVEDELLPRNPFTRLKGPRVPRSSGKTLTVEQARHLLDTARGDRLELAIRLALGLGLRRGEVCGLRWQDIDLKAATLTVNGSVAYTPETGTVYGPTKTPESRRHIDLPAPLVAAIRWHQERQRAERAVMGWGPTEYLFTSVGSGGILKPDVLYASFKRIAKAAGLGEFRLHDLRHSAASFLLAEGVKIKRVQAILGHATATTTMNTYAHLLDSDDSDALERVQRRLNGGDEPDEGDDQAKEKA